MRFGWLLVVVALVAGCSNELAERQVELSRWVGKPETELLAAMGAPARTYNAGGMKFLTYEESKVEIVPGSPYFGPGPFWFGDSGFPPTVTNLVCDTTFTVADGTIRAFSLRGNACG